MSMFIAALLLSMTAQKADPVDNARKTFNNCMIETHNKSVDEKSSPSDFVRTAEAACAAERANYRDVLIRSERSFGSSQKDAEKFAGEEVQMIVDSVVAAFNENAGGGAKLTAEK